MEDRGQKTMEVNMDKALRAIARVCVVVVALVLSVGTEAFAQKVMTRARTMPTYTVRQLRHHRRYVSVEVDAPKFVRGYGAARAILNDSMARYAREQFNEHVGWFTEEVKKERERHEEPLERWADISVEAWSPSDELVSVLFS